MDRIKRKIFGIGTGSGDPELLTMKAIRRLRQCDLVFAPTSRGRHLALDTASAYVKDKKILLLSFPMGEVEEKDYRSAAAAIEEACDQLRMADPQKLPQAAVLTIGDPLIYSTFANLLPYFQEDSEIEIVSGIPSFLSAAAAAQIPLCQGNHGLLLQDRWPLDEASEDKLVLLKSSRFQQGDLEDMRSKGYRITRVSRASLPEQKISHDLAELESKEDYLSLLILEKEGDGKQTKTEDTIPENSGSKP